MRVGTLVEKTNVEANTMKAASSFGPSPMGDVHTTEANGRDASWDADGSVNGVVGFTLSDEPPTTEPPVLIDSFGQTIDSACVALQNHVDLLPPLERTCRSGARLQHLTSKDNENSFACVKCGAFHVIAH